MRDELLDEVIKEHVLPNVPWFISTTSCTSKDHARLNFRDECSFAMSPPKLWGAADPDTDDYVIGKKTACLYKGLVWRRIGLNNADRDDDDWMLGFDVEEEELTVELPSVLAELLRGKPALPVVIEFAMTYAPPPTDHKHRYKRARIRSRWNRIVRLPGRAAIESVKPGERLLLVNDTSGKDFVMPPPVRPADAACNCINPWTWQMAVDCDECDVRVGEAETF